MHPNCHGFLQFHLGRETYHYLGMPFGIPSAPGIYQMLNNVISSLLRHYGVENCLYIDDRCLLQDDDSEHLGWVLAALCTASGHFLSLEKSSLAPRLVFDYLGVRIDCSSGHLSIPPKKKEKFLKLAEDILEFPQRVCYHDLEKLRGRAVSFGAVVPHMSLFIR